MLGRPDVQTGAGRASRRRLHRAALQVAPGFDASAISVTRHGLRADSRYIFLNAPYSGPGRGGTVLIDPDGELVWLGPDTATGHRLTFSAQTYQGRPVLTWFQGLVGEGYAQGELVIAGSSYRTIKTVHAAKGGVG